MPLLSVYQSVRNCDLSSGRDLTVPLSLRLDELWRRPRGCAGGLAGRRSRFPPHPRSAVPSSRASGRRCAASAPPGDRPTRGGLQESAHCRRRRCRRRPGPAFKASTRASLSTTGPRAVLISSAPRLIRRICSAPMRPRLSSVKLTCRTDESSCHTSIWFGGPQVTPPARPPQA